MQIGRLGERGEVGAAEMGQRHHRGMHVEVGQLLAFGDGLVDEVDGGQKLLQQRLAEHQHRGAAAFQLACEAHEQEHVAQALLGIEQDALAGDRPAVPRRLGEIGCRRFGQALARFIGGEARRQLAAHQERNGELDPGAPIVGMERQRAAEAADGFVEPAEIAQAECEVEEALGIVAVERDRLEVMFHRLVEPVGGAQRIAEIGMQRGIVGIGRERQPVMRHRCLELADQPQRDAEIVVQFGVIGTNAEQAQVGRDRLVEPAGAMGLGGQSQLLDETVGVIAEQRRRRDRGL
jgi:hypothetical protein